MCLIYSHCVGYSIESVICNRFYIIYDYNHYDIVSVTVAYLGFHFGGGGVQNIFCKSGGICMARMVHGAIWCVLENILLKFCKIKIVKIFIFYIKIIDNVLLRTLYLGVLEHTPQISCQLCNLVCFGAHFP